MGPCSAKAQSTPHQPNLESLPYLTNGKLGFNVRVANLKLKIDNLAEGKVIMRISNYSRFETEQAKQLYGKIYFKYQHNCQIEATEQELRQGDLNIEIYDSNNDTITSIKINLYLVATGPQHFDYEFTFIQNKKTQSGKISFDFKMAQIVFVQILPKFIEFNLSENVLALEKYYYSLKLLTQKFSFQSEHSDPYEIKAQLKQQGTENESDKKQNKILWLNNNQTVLLNVEVPLIEIATSSVQICLWTDNKDETEQTELMKNQFSLVCETYINLNQMFNQAIMEEQIIENGIKIHKILYKQQNRRLWNHGLNEGTLDFQFELTIPAYLQQLIVGVRTEKGVQQGSSVVNAGQTQVKEIQELNKSGQNLFSICFQLQNPGGLDMKKKLELRAQQTILIRSIIQILKSSEKQSIISFVYKTQQELFNAQKVFIDLAYKFLETADQQEEAIREDFYQILKLLLTRGELDLNQMGYSEETEQTHKKLLKFKTDIGLSYQSLLYSCLDIVLGKLKQKSLNDNERSFVEFSFASFYFKIPEFRNKIILSVQRPDDPPLPEWRSLTAPTDSVKWKEFNDLFDWNKHFYSYLESSPKYQHNIEKLFSTIDQIEWQNRLGKRGIAFFFFLKEWCDHVDHHVVVKGNVPWGQLPGYNNLIKAFFLEMKSRDLRNYPDAMKLAMSSLLNNTYLLSTIIVIIFSKTNLYDAESVQHCLEILNRCLKCLTDRKLSLPTTLDQQFFIKGIKMILIDCEHAFCVAKCIWLLYNNYVLFPLDMRKTLCDIIFDHVAFKFFMHWSFNIRTIFHHLLLYRIFHLHKSNKELNEDDLIEKYKEQVKPKKQHSFFDQKNSTRAIISDVIYMKFFRFMQQIEEGKKLSNQKVSDQMLEEKQFHQAMRAKLISRKIKSKKQLDMVNDTQSVLSQQFPSFSVIPDTIEIQEIPQVPFNQKLQLLEPIKSKTGGQLQQIQITQNQLKYLLKAYIEFDELKFKYQKWKQTQIPTNFSQMNEEEKANFQEQMEVPPVNLQIPIDEKENIIMKPDEW